MNTPVLDWKPNHDPRSKDYPVRVPELIPNTAVSVGTPVRGYRAWSAGPVLNQGNDGACVGYAFTGAVAAEPIDCWPAASPADFDALAKRVFNIARTLDKYPGDDTAYTSVVSGAKAMKALGLIGSYRWAFGHLDVVDALTNVGPVILGLYWKEGMRDAPGGIMNTNGADIGGHCTVAVAHDPLHPAFGNQPAILIQNSYGTGYGTGGFAWLAVADLITLLQRQGEACVVLPA